MADRYQRVHHEGGDKLLKVNKDDDQFRNVRGGEEDDVRKGGKTCCLFFGITKGFHAYAIFDALIASALVAALALGVCKDVRVKAFTIILLLSYLPNVILHLVTICDSSPGIQKAYFYCLQIKLLIAAFMAPLVIVKLINSKHIGIYEGLCGNVEK